MKRVKITGFGLEPKVKHPEVAIEEFKRCGFTFPVFGNVDEANDDLFIDGDQFPDPWAASVFQYEEINEQQ